MSNEAGMRTRRNLVIFAVLVLALAVLGRASVFSMDWEKKAGGGDSSFQSLPSAFRPGFRPCTSPSSGRPGIYPSSFATRT